MHSFRTYLMAGLLAVMPLALVAQAASISLGSSNFDKRQPVEVTADALSLDQESGRAVFDGNVLVVQGEVRLSAGRVEVEYATEGDGSANGIAALVASGGVTFVTPSEAIEAQEARYLVENSQVVLSGNVLLTQGQNAIAGDRLTIDLTAGSGQMEGRVRTVFTPGGDN